MPAFHIDDVQILLRFRNNQILARLEQRKWTVERLLTEMEVHEGSLQAQEVRRLIDMEVSPRVGNLYTETAMRLAQELGATAAILFDHVLKREEDDKKRGARKPRKASRGDRIRIAITV